MIAIETEFNGADIENALNKLEKGVQETVLLSGVAATAGIVYDEVKHNASKHIGPRPRKNDNFKSIFDAVYRVYSKGNSTPEMKVYQVSVNKADAPHWHFLEFGTIRQPAYPYIRPALSVLDKAVTTGQLVMRDRIQKLIISIA